MTDDPTLLEYLKRATAQLHHTRQRLELVQAARTEPIAVIATACRFPGGIANPDDLWRAMLNRTDTVSDFPGDRGWDREELHTACTVRQGSFLMNAADFDPAPFGIAPDDAPIIDPQQRLLLELSWEALERAAVNPRTPDNNRTGVFVGVMYNDYAARVVHGSSTPIENGLSLGSAPSAASGRIAHHLGATGPVLTVDTACSSSLVTMHLACRALRDESCSLALAGGATVMATPRYLMEFSRQSDLAADGRSKAYAAAADGVGWAEGAGMVLLERLSNARRNRHPILGLIVGSAVNHDGIAGGFARPNGPAQQQVIRQALADAHLQPQDIDAVDGHGTGTVFGDPIEVAALAQVYGAARPAELPLWLGSVKSNIGHTQAAAGVAGVIKMLEAMRHKLLPVTLHIDEPTPYVEWDSVGVRLLTETVSWPDTGRPRRAAVSAFGISGTNAHLILQQPPAPDPPERDHPATAVPWVLSASDETALRRSAALLRTHTVGLEPADVAVTLATGRASLSHRAVVVGTDAATLTAGLEAVEAGRIDVISGTVADNAPGRTAFVFPGEETWYPGAGGGLYRSNDVFRSRVDACSATMATRLGVSLSEVLSTGREVDSAQVRRALHFAVVVGLAEVWRSHGITADTMVGSSVGDIAAAHLAGSLTLDEAATLVLTDGDSRRDASDLGNRIGTVVADGHGVIVNVGPDSPVTVTSADIGRTRPSPLILQSLARDHDDTVALLMGLGAAFVAGLPVEWGPAVQHGHPVRLPTYPFHRERFWLDAPTRRAESLAYPTPPREHLHIAWSPLSTPPMPVDGRWAVLDADIAAALTLSGISIRTGNEMAQLCADMRAEGAAPDIVVTKVTAGSAAIDAPVARVEALWQSFLAENLPVHSCLVVLTCGGVSADDNDTIHDLAGAAVRGLARAVDARYPGRLVLVDLDSQPESPAALPRVVAAARASHEPELAVRRGAVLVPRLVDNEPETLTIPRNASSWRLAVSRNASSIELAAHDAAARPPADHEVRIAVRAAGVNFRDVLVGLGVIDDGAGPGGELSGIVVETGTAVDQLTKGDRVLGFAPTQQPGPLAVTDSRSLAPIPQNWTFAQAATVPVAYVTAYTALVDIAGIGRGDRILIHSGAGGVGIAAVQLALLSGAEVFATASPAKWPVLRRMGIDDTHLCSSRTTEFERTFRTTSDGQGMDVVLNALSGTFTDASLRLVAPGGRFVEIGKTDIRDPALVAAEYPGISYRVVNLLDDGADLATPLAKVMTLFANGALQLGPYIARDIRHAPKTFRIMAAGRHVGKNVLTVPQPIDSSGTALVVGSSDSSLVRQVAIDLATRYGHPRIRVVFVGRHHTVSEQLRAELPAAHITQVDPDQPNALDDVVNGISAAHPPTAVVHCFDATVGMLHAWRLHQLTENIDLAAFVAIGSATSFLVSHDDPWTTGSRTVDRSPGAYRATVTGAFIEALVTFRRNRGLPGVFLAVDANSDVLSPAFDLPAGTAIPTASAAIVALTDLRSARGRHPTATLLRDRPGTTAPETDVRESHTPERATAPARLRTLTELINTEAAAVLGSTAPAGLNATLSFSEQGFTSLSALALRNRLATALGLSLPAMLLFNYPTPAKLADYLYSSSTSSAARADDTILEQLRRLDSLLDTTAPDERFTATVAPRLREFLAKWRRRTAGTAAADGQPTGSPDLRSTLPRGMTSDELLTALEAELDNDEAQ